MKLKIGGWDTKIELAETEVDKYCGIGTSDCCIFFTVGVNGPNCERWNTPLSMRLLDRYQKGDMNATRIGCDAVNGLDMYELSKLATEDGTVFVFPDLFKE